MYNYSAVQDINKMQFRLNQMIFEKVMVGKSFQILKKTKFENL